MLFFQTIVLETLRSNIDKLLQFSGVVHHLGEIIDAF